MLREEVEARKRAEKARLKGTWTPNEFQDLITNGLDNLFGRLESDQVASAQQNRIGAQALENRKMQIVHLIRDCRRASSWDHLGQVLTFWSLRADCFFFEPVIFANLRMSFRKSRPHLKPASVKIWPTSVDWTMLMSASYRLLELMESRRRNDELKNLRELEAEENRQLIVELQEAEIERPSSGQ